MTGGLQFTQSLDASGLLLLATGVIESELFAYH
jgi:hypothetical protein